MFLNQFIEVSDDARVILDLLHLLLDFFQEGEQCDKVNRGGWLLLQFEYSLLRHLDEAVSHLLCLHWHDIVNCLSISIEAGGS